MYFEMHGPNCDAKAPGICEGMTAAECKSGYVGVDTFSGQPPTCPGMDGVGVSAVHLIPSPSVPVLVHIGTSLMDAISCGGISC